MVRSIAPRCRMRSPKVKAPSLYVHSRRSGGTQRTTRRVRSRTRSKYWRNGSMLRISMAGPSVTHPIPRALVPYEAPPAPSFMEQVGKLEKEVHVRKLVGKILVG